MALVGGSAMGLVAFLYEQRPELRAAGVRALDEVIGQCWFEVADAIAVIEELSEDGDFEARDEAALLAAKVYFHLGEYDDALSKALDAGDLFHQDTYQIFVDTIKSKAVDKYTVLRQAIADQEQGQDKAKAEAMDARLEKLVNQMVKQSLRLGQFKEALGMAIETRRTDMLTETVRVATTEAQSALISYCEQSLHSFLHNRAFRTQLLQALITLYSGLPNPDFVAMVQCMISLEDPKAVAKLLNEFESKGQVEMGYQIAFDLSQACTQQFLNSVVGEKMSEQLKRILSGSETIHLHQQFLIKNNKTDMLVLKSMKDAVRNAMGHTGTVIANGFMHCGTTTDDFLRENLEWVSKATNWSKFSAVATLGMVHKGHEAEAMKLLEPYLPKDSSGASAGYMEGGAFYALGLIHANHGSVTAVDYLKTQLSEARKEATRHGACLGLGLCGMGTGRQDLYEALKHQLFMDDAVTGEAAGLAMGLVMVGTNSASAMQEMVAYAQDTSHEKTVRGLCVGISLLMYGRLEEADELLGTLLADKEPLLRRAGAYGLGLAFLGTGNADAVRRLLHLAVSDLNDDVRRAAVTSLGFILFRTPGEVPGLVSLLSESYNAHVRYGAAMALGVACAGTGAKEPLDILEPMLKDTTNFVRQGAYIAMAMIMVQHNDKSCPKSAEFRPALLKAIQDKNEDSMAKFGAILASGILNAAGRNATLSLEGSGGHASLGAAVGMLCFLQHWYWFPFSHFLSLAFRPTAIIGLNKDLRMPVMDFVSHARPSAFAYPPLMEEKKKDGAGEKVQTAVLSISAKARQRKAHEEKDKPKEEPKPEPMDLEEEEKKKKEPEPESHPLANPARALKAQLQTVAMAEGSRYRPLKNLHSGGIVMLKDTRVGEEEEVVAPVALGGGAAAAEEGPEPAAPEPFEFDEALLQAVIAASLAQEPKSPASRH